MKHIKKIDIASNWVVQFFAIIFALIVVAGFGILIGLSFVFNH